MGKLAIFFIVCVLTFSVQTVSGETSGPQVKISWHGQACFHITTSKGTEIITDPVNMKDYKVPSGVNADIVTVSHEHFDHNQVKFVKGEPVVLRGLTKDEKDFNEINQEIKDVKIYTVPSYHDDEKGAKRGLNSIFVFEFDGLRVAHLGDLGHVLSKEQIEKIGPIDILMIPVGGKYTIFGTDADKVISQLNPSKYIFPMHYKTDVADFLPFSAKSYLKSRKNVLSINRNSFSIDLDKPVSKTMFVVLHYK